MMFCFRGLNFNAMRYLQSWFIETKINYMLTSYTQDGEQLYNLDFQSNNIALKQVNNKLFVTMEGTNKQIVIGTFDFISFQVMS